MTGLAGLLSNRYHQDDIPDQTGRTAIVTGGTAGIGRQIAKGLAISGARVILVGATEEHGQEAISEINEAVQNSPKPSQGKAEYRVLDLGSLAEVKSFAETMLKELDKLHLLMNDAGVGVAPFGLTKDGLGNHFQVNHLSHMLLTAILLPLLESSSTPRNPSRVVSQSSELHRTAPSDVEFKTVEEMNQPDRDANVYYARSKLMMILFTKQLAKRKLIPDGNKVITIATHPGAVATDQQKGAEEAYGVLGTALKVASKLMFMSPEQGSETALWALTNEKVAQEPEKYQGCYIRQADDSLETESNQAKDEMLALNLWALSKKVIEEKTGFVVEY